MKPFTPRVRRRRRVITYRRLFLVTLFLFMGYAWYQTCDNVCANNNQTMEVK